MDDSVKSTSCGAWKNSRNSTGRCTNWRRRIGNWTAKPWSCRSSTAALRQTSARRCKKQLEEAVGKHFEVRQARRELHLKRLAEELEKLRESIERRNEVREQIIGQRVAELMGKENDLAF